MGNWQGGGIFRLCDGVVLTQWKRGWGGIFHRPCWGRVNTSTTVVFVLLCGVSCGVVLCCVVLFILFSFVLCGVVLSCVVFCCVVLCYLVVSIHRHCRCEEI